MPMNLSPSERNLRWGRGHACSGPPVAGAVTMTRPLFRSATQAAALACAAGILLAGVVIAGPALAGAQQAGQQAGQPPCSGESRTVRSDGAVGPQVCQTPRREQRRRTRITTTTQALPAPDSWHDGIDPPGGGLTVAPAGTVAGDGTGVPLVGVVDIPLRPAPPASGPRPPASPPASLSASLPAPASAAGGNR